MDITVHIDDETGVCEVRDPRRTMSGHGPLPYDTPHQALREAMRRAGWGLYVRRMNARDWNREMREVLSEVDV